MTAELDVHMARPLPPDWGGEETEAGTQIYNAAWDSLDGLLRLWVGPYTGDLNEGWAVTVCGEGVDVVMRCTADQAVEWATNVIAAVNDSRVLATEAETRRRTRTRTRSRR